LLREIAWMMRLQAAAVFGNLLGVVPTVLVVSFAITMLSRGSAPQPFQAHASLQGLSIVGVTPLFAAITGVLLWFSSLIAGLADNWFALRRLREALTHHRLLIQALGPARTERWARWLEHHISGIAGNVALGTLLGMTPIVSQFFGLPLEVRHVTLSAATLAAAAGSLGWPVFTSPEFWLALCGIGVIGLLNVGVAFACALNLSMRARDVPARVRRVVLRALMRRFTASPGSFLFPNQHDVVLTLVSPAAVPVAAAEQKQSKGGLG
jgi:site-specific recombinase